MRVNETLEINEFVEKPTDPKVIADLAVGSGVKSKMKDLIQVITVLQWGFMSLTLEFCRKPWIQI